MDCGSDVFCQFAQWLTDNDLAADGLVALILGLGDKAAAAGSVIGSFLKEYGQTIFGGLGFSFGVWRWWRYHEGVLHKRFEQYIAENDHRLNEAEKDVIQAMHRPGPGGAFWDPLFVEPELNAVLRERNWDRGSVGLSVARCADAQLTTAIEKIDRRIQTAVRATSSLQRQLAVAHTLRGAIGASRAKSMGEDLSALGSFRRALGVPNHHVSIVATELEAHQLRKLKHYNRAQEGFERLLRLANTQDARTQALTIARAKRGLAEIKQAKAILEFLSGLRPGPGSRFAHAYLLEKYPRQQAPGALVIREHFEPFADWDLVEGADLHYLAFMVCGLLGFTDQSRDFLQRAESDYRAVFAKIRSRGWFYRRAHGRLAEKAAAGIRRTELAGQGTFDFDWLVPNLTHEQRARLHQALNSRSSTPPA